MSGWKPIETAPKDGTVILVGVWGFGPDIASASWNGKFWDMEIYGYEYCGYEYCGDPEFSDPTHWMPLPSPPEVTE